MGFIDLFMSLNLVEKISILAGIVTIIVGIPQLISLFVKKAKKPPLEFKTASSVEDAIVLNEPKNPGRCKGREDILNKVFDLIRTGYNKPFIGNHVCIVGREGIGKTHFCRTLFYEKLLYEKVYIGWIECDGNKSIFSIIKKDFNNPLFPYFKGKSREEILSTIKKSDRPCVLFIDQVDQSTSIEEINDLISCPKTTVVVSGLLKKIKNIDDKNHFLLDRLSDQITRIIFEEKSDENFENMDHDEERAVRFIINEYVKGNPFLVCAFARAKAQNENSWKNVLKNMDCHEFFDDGQTDSYLRKILKQLYRIHTLDEDEKKTLSKLCVFSSLEYTEAVFEFSNIPMHCISRLCKTHWLTQKNTIFYHIDEIHRDALRKVLVYSENLRELIISLANYIDSWEIYEDRGFIHISPYVEDILSKVKRYKPQLMDNPDLFARFAYLIADKYRFAIEDNEKSLEWLGYCNPIGVILPEEKIFERYNRIRKNKQSLDTSSDISELSDYFSKTSSSYSEIKQNLLEALKKGDIPDFKLILIYEKAVLEFFVKVNMLNSSIKPFEVEQAYSVALTVAKKFDDFDKKQKYLKEEYCVFLDIMKRYDEVKSLCKEHFDKFGFTLDDEYSCTLYHRYLSSAYFDEDEELIESLIHEKVLDALWNNKELSITVAWSFGLLYRIFEKKGDNETAELYKRHMVILINRQKCFWHLDIRKFIFISSDEEFIEYMHSHDELLDSLNEAIDRKDAEALYLEGRYQEKNGKFNEAFSLYEESAKKDNLKGICSLALMYYRGPKYYNGLEKPQNFPKAREYWDYCNEGERKHRGSHYWLGIMLLDKKYEGNDKKLAKQHFIKAAEMGSKSAIEKLKELGQPFH